MPTRIPRLVARSGRRLLHGIAATLVVTTLATALAGAASASGGSGAMSTPGAARTTATSGTGHKVVLVGVGGLRAEDVDAVTTPALRSLAEDGSVGAVVVRSVRTAACPADGWLAVSAGVRAGDLDGPCRTLQVPSDTGAVPGWADYASSAAGAGSDARLGTLGAALVRADVATAGIGAGAAIALADTTGHVTSPIDPVPAQAADLGTLVRTDLTTADLLVVDLGNVRDPGRSTAPRPASGSTDAPAATLPSRADQVRGIDTLLAEVLDAAQTSSGDVTLLLVSIADSGVDPHLQLALAVGPGAVPGSAPYAHGLLASQSTRQPGYLQTTDLAPTLLSAVGARADAAEGALVGSVVTSAGGPTGADARLAAMRDQDRHAQAALTLAGPVFIAFGVAVILLLLTASTGLHGGVRTRWGRAGRSEPAQARRALRLLRVVGVAVAAVPVASFLANLSPWWRSSSPATTLVGVIAAWVVVITAAALLPPWRHQALGPLGVVSTVTAAVLGVDIATGATLQVYAPMGAQLLEGARFYGFNNTAFALFAAATVLSAAAVADPLVRAGRRRIAAGAVVAIGTVATVLDGLPGLGSDFGGPPALVPAFALLALLAAGVHLTWRKVIAVLAAGAAAVTFFAVLDWLRPADSRTHLGRFVQTALDGGMWPVIARKAAQNLHTVTGSALTLLTVVAVALLAVALVRSWRAAAHSADGGAFAWLSAGTPLPAVTRGAPMVGPGTVATLVALGIALLVNDSGVIIPALGLGLALPVLMATYAGLLLRVQPPSLRPDPGPGPGPTSVPSA